MKKEETQALLAFLDRVNLNGKEAEAMVYLKNKIRSLTEHDGTELQQEGARPSDEGHKKSAGQDRATDNKA